MEAGADLIRYKLWLWGEKNLCVSWNERPRHTLLHRVGPSVCREAACAGRKGPAGSRALSTLSSGGASGK